MGEVIKLPGAPEPSADNLICRHPFEFRHPAWNATYFVQMLRPLAERLEQSPPAGEVPPHYALRGGLAYTIRALYLHRSSEGRMRDVYYLTGLMDCMINQVHPVLRTDLLRDMYKRVFDLKARLNIHWFGPLDQVLLPIDQQFYLEADYRGSLIQAASMKALYEAIRNGTGEMFDILSLEYVFYCPGRGGGRWPASQ